MSIERQKVVAKALKHAAKGQFARAIAEYARLVEADPLDVRARLALGDLEVRQGATETAVAAYTAAAETYERQGFQLKAAAVYKQILVLVPERGAIAARLADVYARSGLSSDALAQLDAAAAHYAHEARWEDVVAIQRRALQIEPSNASRRIALNASLTKLGRPEEYADDSNSGDAAVKVRGPIVMR